MADAIKVLGQSIPSGNSLTAIYTVPGVTSAVVSTLVACNQSRVASTRIRVSVAVAGAADELKQYLVYDAPLMPNETKTFTIGVSLATTDVIRVLSDGGMVSFNLFGVEVT